MISSHPSKSRFHTFRKDNDNRGFTSSYTHQPLPYHQCRCDNQTWSHKRRKTRKDNQITSWSTFELLKLFKKMRNCMYKGNYSYSYQVVVFSKETHSISLNSLPQKYKKLIQTHGYEYSSTSNGLQQQWV